MEATNAGSRAPRGKRRFSHKVSVVVPTYNVERYLDQCLTSIQMQPFANVEVICVNDGSTDGSLGIMQEHAARDPRVRVIDKPNAGYGAACNAGIDGATGDYVAIVEPDDYLTGNMFGDLLDFADSLDGGPVDIVKSSYWRIFNSGTP
ncbi:MAG: glycosyltransferase [Olsenella sp.]|nr:glycosyltransferase [Olsenella sp.]